MNMMPTKHRFQAQAFEIADETITTSFIDRLLLYLIRQFSLNVMKVCNFLHCHPTTICHFHCKFFELDNKNKSSIHY